MTEPMRWSSADDELLRLRWLIDWVNEHASFTATEWPYWEKLQASKEPWNEEMPF